MTADPVLVTLRLVLAAVFLVAGAAKLADPAGSRRALGDLGVPQLLVPVVAGLLPVVELIVAILLVPSSTAQWGAAGAFTLLVLFSAGVALNVARGKSADCHCFGQLRSQPIGRGTLIRNGVLAVLAGVLLVGRDAGPSLDLTPRGAVALAVGSLAVLAVGAVIFVVLEMLRQQGRLLLRLEAVEAALQRHGIPLAPPAPEVEPGGLPLGTAAPTFTLPALDGVEVSLDDLMAGGRPVFLVFSEASCAPCTRLLPEVAMWQIAHVDVLTVAVVSGGDQAKARRHMTRHNIGSVLFQRYQETAEAYRVYGMPGAVVIGVDGRIASPVAEGDEDVRALLAETVAARGLAADPDEVEVELSW